MTPFVAKVVAVVMLLHSSLGCSWHELLACAKAHGAEIGEIAPAACCHHHGHSDPEPCPPDNDCADCANGCEYVPGSGVAVDFAPEPATISPLAVATDVELNPTGEWLPILRHAIAPHERSHLLLQILLI